MSPEELKSEFGEESALNRIWLEHLECFGTTIATTISPEANEIETLKKAWRKVRKLAEWALDRRADIPENERVMLIVGWSELVRKDQGQIFKTGGTLSDIHKIAESQDYEYSPAAASVQPIPKWQKDVFTNDKK